MAFASLFRPGELIFINRHRYVRKAARGAVRHLSRDGSIEMCHGRPRQEQPLLRRVKGCLGAVDTSKRSYFLGKQSLS